MTPQTGAERLLALDAFRGLAALWVVLYHLTLRYPPFLEGRPTPAIPLFPGFTELDAGIVPVLWFFLISGFVITWTIDRCCKPMDFVISRISRIYPAYWASVALTVAVVLLWPLPNILVTPGQVLVNLTMLQAYLLIPNVSGVYWSLAVELMFYVYALALFASGLWRYVHWAALAWAVLGAASAVLDAAGIETSWRLHQLLLLNYAPFLVGGMMLYQLWRGHRPGCSASTMAVCIGAIAVELPAVSTALCLAAMGLLTWACRGGLRWLAAPPLVWLGSVSYPLYLVHEYPSYIMMRALEAASVPRALSIACALVSALGLASLVSYGVERPALRMMRQAWRRAGLVRLSSRT